MIPDCKIELPKRTTWYTNTLRVGSDLFFYQSTFNDLTYLVRDEKLFILGSAILSKVTDYSIFGLKLPIPQTVWTIHTGTVHFAGTDGSDYMREIQTALINAGLNDASIVLHKTLLSQVLSGPLGEVQKLLEQVQQYIGSPLSEVKAA